MSEDSPIVLDSIDDNDCAITIDTGSTITIVRPDVLSEEKRRSLQSVPGWLKTVMGEKNPIQGQEQAGSNDWCQ